MANSSLRLIVRNTSEQPGAVARENRGVASIVDRPAGDLIIAIRTTDVQTASAPHKHPPSTKDLIREHRYTIHPSPDSEKNINTIKLTLRFEDGREETGFQMTRAMKVDDGFVPVFARRLPPLSNKKSDINNENDRDIFIGQFDPKMFTMIMSVFVSNRSRIFSWRQSDDFQINQFETTKFRVLILSSFLTAPTAEVGLVTSYHTSVDNFSAGNDEAGCVHAFKVMREALRLDALDWLEKQFHHPLERQALNLLRYPIYTKRALTGTSEWMKAARRSGNPDFR